MILYGTTHRVGNAISTDDIIAPDLRTSDDPALLAAHCLAQIDPQIAEQAREGDLLLAGTAFGAGSDPDSAVLALQALGLAVVICVDAASDFVAVANVYGLPVIECPAAVAAIESGAILRIDLAQGTITDRATGVVFQVAPCAPALVDAVRRAQLLTRMRRVVEEEGFDG